METANLKRHNENQRIGYLKAKVAIKNGVSEEDLLRETSDLDERNGIIQAFTEHLQQLVSDSAANLLECLRSFKNRKVSIKQVKDSLQAFSEAHKDICLRRHSPESDVTDMPETNIK